MFFIKILHFTWQHDISIQPVHVQHPQLCTLVVFPKKWPPVSQIEISDLRSKYSELTQLIDVEHSKIRRDTLTHIRQAILENILNLKGEQIDIRFQTQQLQAQQ